MTQAYRILIIDGANLAYRRFKAQSGLLKGFLWTLADLWRDWSWRMCFVAWDPDHVDIRRCQIHPGYKANRKEKEAEYRHQVDMLKVVLPWLGVAQLWGDGEADDVIASVVRTYPGPHLIYSTDKDLLQLLKPGVDLLRPLKGGNVHITHDQLPRTPVKVNGYEVVGLDANGWRDLQALMGDSVDGVPGLPRVGPKRAHQLLVACPDVVDRIAHSADGTEAQQNNTHRELRAEVDHRDPKASKALETALRHRETLLKTLELVHLYTIPLTVHPADPDPHRALMWLESFGLARLAERLIR